MSAATMVNTVFRSCHVNGLSADQFQKCIRGRECVGGFAGSVFLTRAEATKVGASEGGTLGEQSLTWMAEKSVRPIEPK